MAETGQETRSMAILTFNKAISHYDAAISNKEPRYNFEEAHKLMSQLKPDELPQSDIEMYEMIADELRRRGYMEQGFA